MSDKKSFRRFWLGQAASNFGDAFGFVAMPLLVFEATHSVVQMGYVTAITGAGQLITATFSGVVVDRSHRRRLMIVCDLARLALYAALPLAALFAAVPISLIYLVAALTAVASNLFMVGYMAAVANLVEPQDVSPANARLQASQALTYVVGSATAGVVASHFGPALALGIDAASFAVSALSLATLRFRSDRAVGHARQHPLLELREGFAFLIQQPALRALAAFQTGVALLGSIGISAAVIDLVVYRLKVDFGASDMSVGVCLALAALGAVLGAIFAGKTRRRFSLGALAVLGTALQAAGLTLGGLGVGLVSVTAAGMLWAGGLTTRAVAATSLRQTLTPDAMLGRVVAAGWTLVFSGSALGAILVTRLAAAVGTAHAMTEIGLALAAVSLAGALSPLALGMAAPK